MAINRAEDLQPAKRGRSRYLPLAGNRSQTMQRLQIGLFGLAAMVLLVSLASIISNSAQESEARVVPEAAPTVVPSPRATTARDPLADAGVVPEVPDQPALQITPEPQDLPDDAAPAFQP